MTRRIVAIASGGGHWTQMRRLLPALENLDVAFVSVGRDYAEDVPKHRYYSVRNAHRLDKKSLIILTLQLLRIVIVERPDIVMTTGAAPGFICIVLSKILLRSKTMWIDSLANCEEMSLSGRLARRFTDAWLTQWPHLQRDGGPYYWGAVL